MQLSKAASIPEELFLHILWHAGKLNVLLPALSTEEKPHVAAYASVCRYWARHARPQLFYSITLRNPEDVECFQSILDTPTLHGLTSVARAVYTLTAAPDSREKPWLHQVFFVLVPKLPFATINVVPLHSVARPLRTLHPSLPRSLPVSVMSIRELHLEAVHFLTGRVLLSLLSSIRLSPLTLKASNITFGTKLTLEDFGAVPFRSSLLVAESEDLQLCLSLLPLLISDKGINLRNGPSCRRPTSVLNEDDMKTLCDLLGIFDAAPWFQVNAFTGAGESQLHLRPTAHLNSSVL